MCIANFSFFKYGRDADGYSPFTSYIGRSRVMISGVVS